MNFLKPFKATHIVVKDESEGNFFFPVGYLLENVGSDLYRNIEGVHLFVNDCYVKEIAQQA